VLTAREVYEFNEHKVPLDNRRRAVRPRTDFRKAEKNGRANILSKLSTFVLDSDRFSDKWKGNKDCLRSLTHPCEKGPKQISRLK